MKNSLFGIVFVVLLTGCSLDFKEKANQQFGDQHFKTVIALVELHKVREGEYPLSLDSLKYLGDWDLAHISSVKYQRLNDDEYELDLINGWLGKPKELEFPEGFWNGLGCKKSNFKKDVQ